MAGTGRLQSVLLAPYFVHSMESVFITAIPQVVNQKDAHAGQREERLPRPLLNQVRGNHGHSGEWISVAVDILVRDRA